MNEYDVKRLALVLAIQAEIEGMKAENSQYESSQPHPISKFNEKAEELRNLAYTHNEQLFS